MTVDGEEKGAEEEVELSYGSNFSDLGMTRDSFRTLQDMITNDRGRPVLSPACFPVEQQDEVELNFGSDISNFVMSRDWLNAVKELNTKHRVPTIEVSFRPMLSMLSLLFHCAVLMLL